MRRLVAVSNRVADLASAAQSGGLATALVDALSEQKGLWFGWDGRIVEDGAATGISLSRADSIAVATQPLTQSEFDTYYLGFANGVLWPVFHYRLDLATFDPEFANGYYNVSQRFAQSLAALVDPDDLIWVHDYQLIPMASALRKLGVRNKIGFFLHIPFPGMDVLTAVPDHRVLIGSMLDYDLIGFQTQQDRNNFVQYCEGQLGATPGEDDTVSVGKRTTVARSFPIGIDVEAFQAMAWSEEADNHIATLRRMIVRTYIIGVDRLDYSKGLPDRFKAFRRFLELHPEHRKTAVLMQIAPPTREGLAAYTDIRSELEQLSGAINGEFGDFDWMPVRYIHRAVPRGTLAALFRGSKIGLVTPLRDGMNLVAKEYIAAQDAEDPGVLVLSQFAGAAEDLEEALIVNPYDTDQVAQAIQRAFIMPLDERKSRHAALLDRVKQRDVSAWRHDFLDALANTPDRVFEPAV